MARKSKTNKNVVIVALIVLLLLLAVGYAAFSDTLTISGTANAKGTFDLQFENAEIVKAVGVTTLDNIPETVASADDAPGIAIGNITSAKISADGNTLNVNVADLAYPGAGVEFSVDIVNKGSISAKVNDLTTDGLQGNDIIKIEGLDQITREHPTIKAGEKCNIHFIVYWPEESTAVLPEEGTSVNFSLGIEYTQSDDNAMFDGKASHDGNIVETNPVVPAEETLAQKITPKDYGRAINYSVTVNGEVIDNWKIFSNDGANVKIISADIIAQTAIPEAAKTAGLELVADKTYNVSASNRDALIKGLTEGWEDYAKGIDGATAKGAPTNAEFVASWNGKYANDQLEEGKNKGFGEKITSRAEEKRMLYIETAISDACNGYWLATTYNNNINMVWAVYSEGMSDMYNGEDGYERTDYGTIAGVEYSGFGEDPRFSDGGLGVRPVVTLPSNVLGEVSDTVTINQ